MKIPRQAPQVDELLTRLRVSPQRVAKVFDLLRATVGERYVHWEKLQRLQSPEGLSSEEWWLAIKLARAAMRRGLPLTDTRNIPFGYCLPDPALEYLHDVDQDAGGRLELPDRPELTPGSRDRYLVRSLMEEAITSSQLEGAATTRLVAKELIRTGRAPTDRSEQMILNNYRAMERIRGLRDREMDQAMLLELHRVLTEGTLDDPSAVGRFRRAHEPIRVYDQYGEVMHDPPAAETLPERVSRMCAFANGSTPDYFVPPVVRAIILHFWLAYDHPFVDGNGRCARALFYWSMLREGAWLCEFISISEIIKKAPARYGRAFLYSETDGNDLTYFVLYHLETIRKAFAALKEYVDRKTVAARGIEGLLRRSDRFNYRQLALLSHAMRHPDASYTVQSHRTSHNIVYQTARTDLLRLAEAGLLRTRRIGKAIHFEPAADLEQLLRRLR